MDGLDLDPQSTSGARSAKRPPRHQSTLSARAPVDRDAETVRISQGTMIGEYRVERRLDEGGMGTVYAALHPVIHKRVAIKVLHPHIARQEEAVARFIQEARAVNAIGHPGIVDIFGFGRFVDERHYITMEYLEGQQLLAFLNEHGPVSSVEMLAVAAQLAESLAAAHDKGVVHRDMKPENVFLSITAGEYRKVEWPPRTKILDFGLAKLLEAERDDDKPHTRAGVTVGTPYYMSPEQCRGKPIDARSDVYALGVMMYEMITGRVPFYAPDSVDVLYMHLTQAPEPPSRHRPVPPEVEELVLRCMAKQADDRPASMHRLLSGIGRLARNLLPDGGAATRPEEELQREASAFFGEPDDSSGASTSAPSPAATDSNRVTKPGISALTVPSQASTDRPASSLASASALGTPPAPAALSAPATAPASALCTPPAPATAPAPATPPAPAPMVTERSRSAAPVPSLPDELPTETDLVPVADPADDEPVTPVAAGASPSPEAPAASAPLVPAAPAPAASVSAEPSAGPASARVPATEGRPERSDLTEEVLPLPPADPGALSNRTGRVPLGLWILVALQGALILVLVAYLLTMD